MTLVDDFKNVSTRYKELSKNADSTYTSGFYEGKHEAYALASIDLSDKYAAIIDVIQQAIEANLNTVEMWDKSSEKAYDNSVRAAVLAKVLEKIKEVM